MSALDRLLAALPVYFDRDPERAPGLTVALPSGAMTLTIAQRTLSLRAVDMAPVSIALTGQTLDGLAEALTGLGLDAQVAGDGSASALGLLDVKDLPLVASSTPLDRFTSLLWIILAPMGWALDDLVAQIRSGLAEMAIPTADGKWINLWGEDLYGGIYQLLVESDRAYAMRIIKEATRWRLNRHAIEAIIQEELGVDAVIRNLHDDAWVMSRTAWGYLAGWKYQRTEFEVAVDGLVEGLDRIIERNRAAGTLPFYRYRLLGGSLVEGEQVGAPAHITATAPIIADLVWTMSRSVLGRVSLARPWNVGVASYYLARGLPEQIWGAGSAFILGTSELGSADTLGGGGSGGVDFSESWERIT